MGKRHNKPGDTKSDANKPGDTKPESKSGEPKPREDNPAKEKEHASAKPFIDRQLNKAVEVIKEKLAASMAKK